MSCPSLDSDVRITKWGKWSCKEKVDPCPDGFHSIGQEWNRNKEPNSCFGDFVDKVDRTRHICKPNASYYSTDINSIWECCSGKRLAKDCHTKYCRGSRACNDFLAKNCTPTAIFDKDFITHKVCNEWCNNNKSLCNSSIIEFCQKNPNDIACQHWGVSNPKEWHKILIDYCSDNITTELCRTDPILLNRGGIDNTATKFCKDHPEDPFCSCYPIGLDEIKDPVLRSVLSNPKCYNAACISHGYKTEGQRLSKCPEQLNVCANSTEISGSNIDAKKNAQQCAINAMTGNNELPQPIPEPEISKKNDNNILLFLFFIIILLIAFAIIGYAIYDNFFST